MAFFAALVHSVYSAINASLKEPYIVKNGPLRISIIALLLLFCIAFIKAQEVTDKDTIQSA